MRPSAKRRWNAFADGVVIWKHLRLSSLASTNAIYTLMPGLDQRELPIPRPMLFPIFVPWLANIFYHASPAG